MVNRPINQKRREKKNNFVLTRQLTIVVNKSTNVGHSDWFTFSLDGTTTNMTVTTMTRQASSG